MKIYNKILACLFFIFLILIFSKKFVLAAASENYKIQADVIGSGGTASTSGSYHLTDTLGEPVIGISNSENYKTKAGFWYMVNFSISLLVDSNLVDFGSLAPGTPVEGQSTLTVTTDSWGGYDLLASENGKLTHTDTVTTVDDFSCPISSPCLWSGTGLGFTINSGTSVDPKWGSSPNYKYAAFPLIATVFHEKTGFTSGGDNTEVGYKIDVPSTQKSGAYSNIITYTAMAKL